MGIFSKKSDKKEVEAVEAQDLAPTEKAVTEKKAVAKTAMSSAHNKKMQAANVILQPIVTEKSTVTGTYHFKVSNTANRVEVKKAFVTLYGKTPAKVNIINVLGKKKRFGARMGKRADWKKAIVYLAKGETLDIFVS